MTIKNSDVPAMPLPLGNDTTAGCDGLTKREMMAMHMMSGLFSKYGDSFNEEEVARYAIRAADALLAELEHTK